MAKMDATENDIEDFPINKYPTIKLCFQNCTINESTHRKVLRDPISANQKGAKRIVQPDPDAESMKGEKIGNGRRNTEDRLNLLLT